jgi:hypothetical protein
MRREGPGLRQAAPVQSPCAGLPAFNQTFWCNGPSCYTLVTTAANYGTANSTCNTRGGHLVGFCCQQLHL